MICPKCAYARTAADINPAWQCPRCGIAYAKYSGALAQAREHARKAVTPLRAEDTAPHFALDGSVWTLVGANAFALGVAYWQQWSIASLMIVYWAQGVIIGIANVFRILALDKFSTENFTIDDKPVDPTPETKLEVAGQFVLLYAFVHAVYLLFLLAFARGERIFTPWFVVCMAVFALNHYWSYRYNRNIDRQGTPNIGTLMGTSFLRIIPMHLMVLLGGLLGGGTGGLWLFAGLKTLADVTMHVVAHGRLKKVRTGAGGLPTA